MNKSVYIIDDDECVREVMIFALEDEGFFVKGFKDAKEALDVLHKSGPGNYPDLILVDYQMPEMDGLAFIRELNIAEFRHIPVILNSAAEDLAIPEGILNFPKPINLEDLLSVVKNFSLQEALSGTSVSLDQSH